jgi:alkylated DNA repair dioxygenase AlkB
LLLIGLSVAINKSGLKACKSKLVVSYLVDEAQRKVDRLFALNKEAKDWPPVNGGPLEFHLSDEPEEDLLSEGGNSLPNTVCNIIATDHFEEISVSDVLAEIPITGHSTYGRKVAYFGKRSYSYGSTHHSPRDYPASNVMDQIVCKLKTINPAFSTDDFSCLLTLYPDGRSTIPAHSDNETHIKSDSLIYTVSLGATREMEFTKRTGSLQEHRVSLAHGSVYTMTAASQEEWSHKLIYDANITDARISLTFRHIIEPPAKCPAPPLLSSAPVNTHSPTRKQKILLLTDSLLNSTPEHIFNKVNDHRCVRMRSYRLSDLPNFEQEFKHCHQVILSMGINDLSTSTQEHPQMSGQSLADWLSRILRHYCSKHRNTTFIINSLLHTRHGWLNDEVDIFNYTVYQLATTIPNLEFFNSHAVIIRSPISRNIDHVLLRDDPRGMHLTFAAKRLITDRLVEACVFYIDHPSSGHHHHGNRARTCFRYR